MNKPIVALALVLAAIAGAAEPLPLPEGPSGSCPQDRTRSGSFCFPAPGAPEAIYRPPGANCPHGWLCERKCLHEKRQRRTAMKIREGEHGE